MGKASGQCVVCGASPTVKAHLISRALVHDVRGNAKSVVEGKSTIDGVRFRQSGAWDDDLLCAAHEELSGLGEDYTVRLIRNVKSDRVARPEGGFSLPNPKPDLLLRFVYSTVWKSVVSKHRDAALPTLGPYEARLRDIIFGNGLVDLEVLVRTPRMIVGSTETLVIIPPYQQRLKDWRIWHFVVGPMEFFLKTDARPFPREWSPYIANGNDPLVVMEGPPLDLARIPMLQPVLGRMRSKRKPTY